MATPLREDVRRLAVTLTIDRYDELRENARSLSLSMTSIVNQLIGDYLKAQKVDASGNGAGLAERVENLEKQLAAINARFAPKRRRSCWKKNAGDRAEMNADGGNRSAIATSSTAERSSAIPQPQPPRPTISIERQPAQTLASDRPQETPRQEPQAFRRSADNARQYERPAQGLPLDTARQRATAYALGYRTGASYSSGVHVLS